MTRFHHLANSGNSSEFPNVNGVNVYKYDNNFDYSNYDEMQMVITLCHVPWDMGEAHVGNRTISGIGNVVYFGSKTARNEYFKNLNESDVYVFKTKFKELHRDKKMKIPVPFDVAAQYNYAHVHYEPFANESEFVEYETADGVVDWFWFIREVEFTSPNTTTLHLLLDAWQTFIYDVDIPYMMLERGHAPMAQTSVAKYLANPISNSQYLLAPEMDGVDSPRISRSSHEKVFNSGSMYALIITSSAPAGNWGLKANDDWKVAFTHSYPQGTCGYRCIAIAAIDLSSFISNCSALYPQFLQTVQAIAFVSEDLIDLGESYTFADTNIYDLGTSTKSFNVHTLAKSDFKFDGKYANIAKLYTYPYSVIELADETGNITFIRVEDTNGKITFKCALSLVFPWLKLSGHVTSVGKSSAKTVSYANITNRNFHIGGNWYEMIKEWNIPTFGIIESAAKVNDYATHFERKQAEYAYSQQQTSDNASANAAQSNENANADNVTANAALSATANSSITARSNSSALTDSIITQTYNTGIAAAHNIINQFANNSTISAAEKQGSIGAASSAASGIVGAIASGNPVAGAAAIAGGAIGAVTTLASTAVSVGLTSAEASYTQAGNSASATASNSATNSRAENQVSAAHDIATYQNTLTTSSAANTSATMKANANRSAATAIANAQRSADVAASAISNSVKQAALGAPEIYGDFANGEHATTRPIALFSTVVTQDDYTIARCGDEFLRYGYMYNRQWKFDGNWCVMPKFTYWKLSDFNVKGLNVPDMYVDMIRFFLFGGVTVWSNPDYIGVYSIYEND